MTVYAASEQALTSSVATLMIYDSATRKWNDTGQSNVQICQNIADNTFRVVGSHRQSGQVSVVVDAGRY